MTKITYTNAQTALPGRFVQAPPENTSAEQQARDILERMDVEGAQSMTAGDVVELANLIRDRDQLRAALDAMHGEFGENFPDDCNGAVDMTRVALGLRR